MSEVSDNYVMQFGKYKGEKIANVPAGYLLYMYENDALFGAPKKYVEENHERLLKERGFDESVVSELDTY